MEQLFDFLIKKDVEYKRNEPMSSCTSVRIGGIALAMAFPDTQDKLVGLMRFLHKNGIRHKLIGRMTNVLPCDDVYEGVLVSTRKLDRYYKSGHSITAECGVLTSALLADMAREGLGGAEGLCGIPGSVGGMIASSAGAFGCEIGDIVKSVEAYSCSSDRILKLRRDDIGFSYRNSVFRGSDMVILSAELQLVVRDKDIILQEMGKIRLERLQSQPLDYPSLGSIFKRVNDLSAARMIDECGLKGISVGDAEISQKHAGFIVNKGSATAADFVELISMIKREVWRRYNVELEEEIEFL